MTSTSKPAIRQDTLTNLFPPRIDDSLMVRADAACKVLGIKPRVLANEINDLLNQVMAAELRKVAAPKIRLGLIEVNYDEIAPLMETHLKPSAMKTLLALRAKGALPTVKRELDPVPADLAAYAERSDEELLAESERMRAAKQEEKAKADRARREKLDNLAALQESEFTYSFLNELFWHHGIKNGSLEVGGIEVHKGLSGYSSNSGKSRDWSMSFSWTSSDGVPRELSKESRFKDNRRNDADRDWGLPE